MNTSREKIRHYLFFTSIFLIIGFGILFPRLSLPFGLAYIIYAMVKPLKKFIEKQEPARKKIYTAGILLINALILVPLIYSLLTIDTDIQDLKNQLPRIQSVIELKYYNFRLWLNQSFGIELKANLVSQMAASLQARSEKFLVKIPTFLSSALEWVILLPLFLYFFFSESHKVKELLLAYIPNPLFEKTYVLYHQFNTKFSDYIMAKFIEATLIGVSIAIGLAIIGVPYWPLLALFAGITNILPYIGPVLGFIPALLVTFLVPEASDQLFVVSMVYLVANAIDMFLVFPLLVSKIVNLHPILVIVSVIVGSQLGGVVGMIICIPITAFIKLLVIEIYKDLYYQY
ncbi:MAG: AI-2E family transporter [Bacteriovoracaceae bacterium]